MKKRNKYYQKEKDFIKFNKVLEKNYQSQKDLGWVELDTPIFIGYEAYLEPRIDIQQREDAWVFWSLCENLSTRTFARKIEYFDWNKSHKNQIYIKPHIKSISESVYNSIYPQISKWFSNEIQYQDTKKYRKWRSQYYCTVPNFYFDVKYIKVFRYKIKIFDELLKQEESEIKSILKNKFYNYRYEYNSPKSFRKKLNKSQRSKSKQTLYNIVYREKEQSFEDCYKGANYLWW